MDIELYDNSVSRMEMYFSPNIKLALVFIFSTVYFVIKSNPHYSALVSPQICIYEILMSFASLAAFAFCSTSVVQLKCFK